MRKNFLLFLFISLINAQGINSNINSDVSKIYIDATNKFEKIFGSKVKLKEDLNGKILLSAKFKSINDLYTILKKLSN